MTSLSVRLLPLLMIVAVLGCSQGEQDRCQITADCADDLVCLVPPGGSVSEGGVCAKKGTVFDASSNADLTKVGDGAAADQGTADQGSDAAAPADLAMPDLAMPDLATPDLATPDLATPPDLAAGN